MARGTLEARLGHRFADAALLEEALTHPSEAATREGAPFNYQRLEFLGDAVLGLLIAEMLYRLFPRENEGAIARRHAALVCSGTLLQVAEALELGEHLDSEAGRDDACEALLGALYLDGGLGAARQLVTRYWEPFAREITAPPKDAKTSLQEWSQGHGYGLPTYRIREQTGPAHAPQFVCEVEVTGFAGALGTGASKRTAEQAAARAMLEQVEEQ